MKYRVIAEELNYIGHVTERNVLGEFSSRGWADPFAEMVRENLKAAIEHRMLRIVIEKEEEL